MDPPVPETWPGPIRFPVSRPAAPGPEFLRPETEPTFRPVSPARNLISKIRRRTGRANAGCSRKVSVIRDSGNCVVADAVRSRTRLPLRKFPSRPNNREFHRFDPVRRMIDIYFDPQIQSFCGAFPWRSKREFFRSMTGISNAPDGYYFRGSGPPTLRRTSQARAGDS